MGDDQHNKAEQGAASDRGDVRAFLRQYAPFDDMTDEHLGYLVDRLAIRVYARGEALTHPDRGPVDRLFIIRSGRVGGESPRGDDQEAGNVWELRAGECFPVGALVTGKPARTIHRALEETTCLELEEGDFTHLLHVSEEFHAFCTRRLSTMLDQLLAQYQSQEVKGLGNGDTSLDIPLGERLRREPVTCREETTIKEALQAMDTQRVGSIVVTDDRLRPLGVFTLHDLLRRVALPQVPLDRPMREVMTPDPVSMPRSAFAFEAAMVMAQHGIHHVCVVERGRLQGVISERDLFTLQRVGLVNLTRSIRRAASVEALAPLQADIHRLVGQMIDQGVKVGQIMQMITLLNDHIGERIIQLCLAEADDDVSDIDFCWIAFGSEGRQEQTLKTDQDNGILFMVDDDGPDADAIRARLVPVAQRINQALDRCGYPLCPGNIMAGNPECCLSLEEWQQRFKRWIDQGTPEHLLKAAIFFDFRVIHGPTGGAEGLRTWLLERTSRNSRFRKQMAANALRNRPPLGVIRDFVTRTHGDQRNVIDLKLNGVTPFVDAARIFSLAHRLPATNTVDRLEQAAEAGALVRGDVEAWVIAYHYIQVLRTRQHQEQAAAGKPLSNHVSPNELNELDKKILKEAFREARKLQSKLTSEYQL
ncbi:DUF294 nucleotidyltransferase-like domain-containing protein [Alkalilimnicola ehrlichii]|uniref:DUF294 nucleotidyltransferase-like domain-containing protein n=1 Tax=Alkalilimnicola ehrlichii TaxID=351052 RepID=UPI003BA06C66